MRSGLVTLMASAVVGVVAICTSCSSGFEADALEASCVLSSVVVPGLNRNELCSFQSVLAGQQVSREARRGGGAMMVNHHFDRSVLRLTLLATWMLLASSDGSRFLI